MRTDVPIFTDPELRSSGQFAIYLITPPSFIPLTIISELALQPGSGLSPDAALLKGIPLYTTEGSEEGVHFVHGQRDYRFAVHPNGTWMDVQGVMEAFNRFMGEIGRPERAYRLESPRDWGGEAALFLCADEQRFAEVSRRLRLPFPRERGRTGGERA